MKRVPVKDLAANVLSLPRLPIPELNKTAERYRSAIRPLRGADTVNAHLKKLDAFLCGSAPKLHQRLVDMDAAQAKEGTYPFSYIEQAWHDMYLGNRDPLVVHTNPSFSLKALKGGYSTQAGTAAAIASGLAQYVRSMVSEGVAVKNPGMDLSPQLLQFGSALVPQPNRDEFVTTPLDALRHIVVLHDGHPYRLRVINSDGTAVNQAEIQRAIEYILTITPDSDNMASPAVMTSASRNMWATAYGELLKSPENKEVLQQFNEAIVVMCLDSKAWGGDVVQKHGAMIHGNVEEMENRWYDKHQVIVSADGQIAFTFEHSHSDGLQWTHWLEEVVALAQQQTAEAVSAAAANVDGETAAAHVKPMHITIGKGFAPHVRNARAETQQLIRNTAFAAASIPYGKDAIKAINMSPDAFAQMTFQTAYFNLRKKPGSTYEASSTSGFYHGRTETIRSCTEEMLSVSRAVTAASTSNTAPKGTELQALIQAAATRHVALARDASQGQGVDRHLMALRLLASQEHAGDAAAFFDDELHRFSKTWLLSTSNVSNPLMEYFAFGPVTPNGYGIGYVVDKHEIRCSLSAFVESTATDVAEFKVAILDAADRIYRAMSKPGSM